MKRLLSSYPELVKEWHPTKNGESKPGDYTHGSGKEVWWRCPNGHSYKSSIVGRTTRSRGCPFCAGKAVCVENSLSVNFPELVKEWHPTKNGNLRPEDFTYGSNKKVWWLCPKNHPYKTLIKVRTRKNKNLGCPVCAGQMVIPETSFAALFPDLLEQWDWEKNKQLGLDPYKIRPGADKKLFWKCSKGSDHRWQASINARTGAKKHGCPFCSGRRPCKKNNLAVLFPEIAKQWHPTKNGNLTPVKVTAYSNKKVFWMCRLEHYWESTIDNRTNNGTGCPFCSGKISKAEIRVYTELLHFFPTVEWRARVQRREVDILVKQIGLAVELDGYPWHLNKEEKDLAKNKHLERNGLTVFRFRDAELDKIHGNTAVFKANDFKLLDFKNLLNFIAGNFSLSNTTQKEIKRYLKCQEDFIESKEYKKAINAIPSPIKGKRLSDTHPHLEEEWDFDKNKPLTPKDVSEGAHHKVFWICKTDPSHRWQAVVKDRTGKESRCPFCSKDDRQGEKHHNFDSEEFRFKNQKTDEVFLGTRFGFFCAHGIDRSSISKLIKGKRKIYKGWVLDKLPR